MNLIAQNLPVQHAARSTAWKQQKPQERQIALPLLSEEEWQRVVIEWNDTRLAYPEDQCNHQLFEAQVECSPDSPAVIYQDTHLHSLMLEHLCC